MIKLIKDWYEDNFTDPNQVSLALVLIFSVIVTYILVQTQHPAYRDLEYFLTYMSNGLPINGPSSRK